MPNYGQRVGAVPHKFDMHHGAAIAIRLNNELDYFGQRVNITEQTQALADTQETCLTGEVRNYPGVRERLAHSPTQLITVEF